MTADVSFVALIRSLGKTIEKKLGISDDEMLLLLLRARFFFFFVFAR